MVLRRGMVLALILVGCGGGGGKDEADGGGGPVGPDGSVEALPMLPLAPGNSWSYREYDPLSGLTSHKTTTVVGQESLDGAKAGLQVWRLESVNGSKKSRVFLGLDGALVVRHREETLYAGSLVETKLIHPFSLRVPVQAPDASWTRDQSEEEQTFSPSGLLTKTEARTYRWKVGALNESVTVPAGTFKAVRLERISASGKDKTTWWVPGVGKVKEDELGATEELEGFELK